MASGSKPKSAKNASKIVAIRQVFISHSHEDAEFAQLVDATLLSCGVKTFVAERDIRVGDSIPERIYEGIGAATDLIYVISLDSVRSPWVQEELSIAKMRQKESSGFRIFPLLIDDLTLPTGIVHIKYADFRAWRSPASYRASCLELMGALGITPHVIDRYELRWYITHSDSLNSTLWRIANIVGVLEGGIYASLGQVLEDGYLPNYMPTKFVLEDDDLSSIIIALQGLIEDKDAAMSNRLQALCDSIQEAVEAIYSLGSRKKYSDIGRVEKLLVTLRRICNMLRELQGEAEITLFSTVRSE